ncbi:MAG TPA: tyrosine-type recombinase/integrase, partial [Terriglobales bacterium]|nr:tyrosine-type recombinase/integrase [Terriglobales bacterium]
CFYGLGRILARPASGRSIEKSLGTSDRAQAEVLALPYIAEHKAKLLAARPRIEPVWRHQYEPGREHAIPDGGRIIATDHELIHLDAKGIITGRSVNGGAGHAIFGLERRLGLPGPIGEPMITITDAKRPILPTKNGDDAILETYLEHANITGHFEREARNVWALYKTLTDSKPLRDASRDDGRKLVAHFEAGGLKSATIQKKIGWLTAAVNLAIKENKLKFNPFSGIIPKRDDKAKRLPLSEADMKETKRNLRRLGDADQLLFRLLASTGMRLSEAFEIDGEFKERGCRYVIVGKKTEQSERRVPLPASVLPFLPGIIKGPLFRNNVPAASKRLNRFLNDCGIADPRKVVHSLRHRAQDRLRAAGCPEDVRWALLGHEEKTVAAGYGEGFPVPLLRKWIDKIGL